MILKNNATTEDPRLDRLVRFDERSRNFKISDVTKSRKPRSYTWACCQHLNQGREGACVGFGITHELIARPAEARGLDAKYAKETIYWQAQREDPWPGGSYPGATPFYEGTNVLDGVRVAHKLGWFKSYRWAFGIDDLILGIGHNGPAILGVNWYEGMFQTDLDGYIHVRGNIAGGHCILAKAFSVKRDAVLLHNSWGLGWGIGGDAWISVPDMTRLLRDEGEAVFLLGRHSKHVR